ncbi:hypothetical protein EVAR_46170_1 [Eumeta japonica]|uniref:Uncharacterized protein n=1 Tax=Eumeta variegata TaxID=151549 RepID=A0A4C1Y0D2_EUMVA|nr:hypothetical protein EVAR_46170_1 [Eumeta japonica]
MKRKTVTIGSGLTLHCKAILMISPKRREGQLLRRVTPPEEIEDWSPFALLLHRSDKSEFSDNPTSLRTSRSYVVCDSLSSEADV